VNIVLLSNHWYPSPRKAGFHHLANAWHAQGHSITFATVGFSWLSYARRDFRSRYPGIWQARNSMQAIAPGLDSYVHFTPLHPHTTLLSRADRLLAPWMDRYDRYSLGQLRQRIQDADVLVYESNAALFLVRLCRALAPQARHIYRVSDDIRTMRSTPSRMVALEQELASEFSLISVPCAPLAEKFPGLSTVRVQHHGLDKAVFDACSANPFAQGTSNAVFCGLGFYDAEAVHHMAEQCQNVDFHILGIARPRKNIPAHVIYYGEIPFEKTIPFIKFASCGLYTLHASSRPMSAYTDSLKIMQYRYCGLPIVAPDFIDLHRDGVFYYTPGNAPSCCASLQRALQHGSNADFSREVRTWNEVAAEILATSAK
jgi:2-beta-glucuronyltransferase